MLSRSRSATAPRSGRGADLRRRSPAGSAKTRRKGLEFGVPVRIGSDVWIGGGAIILPA
jgi:maltose O-acetyltransferase